MKLTPWDWDYVIHRHLEGGLTDEQLRALNHRLAEDPALRRRLAELAFEQVALRQPATDPVGTGPKPLLKPAAPRKPRRHTRRKKPGKPEGRDHDLN
jgi:anti-sigma factor RsiW